MSAQWYYSNDRHQQSGPVPEDQLRALIAQGRVRPEHLIWKDGLASWARVDASELRAYLPRVDASAPKAQTSQPQPRKSNRPWIGIAIGVTVLIVLAIMAAIVLPLLAHKPTLQATGPAPAQPVSAPDSPSFESSNTSPAPQVVPNQISNKAASADIGALKIEKRSIIDKNDKLDINVNYPHTGIASIDNEIETWARGEIENIRKEQVGSAVANGSGWSLEIGYTVERNDEKIVAFNLGESSYTGGAHGYTRATTFNYLMPDGHRVELPDILDTKALAIVSTLAIADLKRQSHENDDSLSDDMIESGAGPDWKNFSAFIWLPTELHIYFAPYQVGPYSAGPQEVHIPLTKLQGLIRADWRAPLPPTSQASQPAPSQPMLSQAAQPQPVASPSPSFDCTKATTFIEKEVCRDPVLAGLDAALSKDWKIVYEANVGDAKQDLLVAQRAWLAERNQCTDNTCLRAVYRKRIGAICAHTVIDGTHLDCTEADRHTEENASE